MSHPTSVGSLPGLGTRAADERKAALLLHALPPAERRWFIDRLPPRQAGTLLRLLEELKVLGLSADADLVHELLAAASAASATPPAPPASEVISPPDTEWQSIDAAEPLFMARLLSVEPVTLIADVLGLRTWSWAPAVLDLLSPVTRQGVMAALAQSSDQGASEPGDAADIDAGRRRDERLLQVLRQRCASTPRDGSGARAATAVRPRASRRKKPIWFRRWVRWVV